MGKPGFLLTNNFGEKTLNHLEADAEDSYDGEGSYQVIGPDLNVDADAGSDDSGDPSFIAAGMFNLIGAALSKAANYLAGVIGAYSLTGAKATEYPSAGILGIISDGVTEVDGAVVGHIDGDSEVTRANAIFKARMTNSVPGSGADYGLDLQDEGFGAYNELEYAKAAIRLGKDVVIFSGATAPVNGTTGDNFAGKGSLYIALDTGVLYANTGAIDNPTWTIVGSQS